MGPGRTGRREGKRGDHGKYLPFVGRVLGQVWRGKDIQEQGNFPGSPKESVAVSYHDPPPLHTHTSKYYQLHISSKRALKRQAIVKVVRAGLLNRVLSYITFNQC